MSLDPATVHALADTIEGIGDDVRHGRDYFTPEEGYALAEYAAETVVADAFDRLAFRLRALTS